MKTPRIFVENEDGSLSIECRICGQVLGENDFYEKGDRWPHNSKSHWQEKCKKCAKEYKTAYYRTNSDRINKARLEHYYANPEYYQKKNHDRTLSRSKNPEALLRRRAVQRMPSEDRYLRDRYTLWKRSADHRALLWTLEPTDISKMLLSQCRLCYYTNHPLVFAPNDRFTLSIDRIDSNRGYNPDNVVLCGALINKMKLDLSVDDFREIVSLLHSASLRW